MSTLGYLIVSNTPFPLIPTPSMDFVAWMPAMKFVWRQLDNKRRANVA